MSMIRVIDRIAAGKATRREIGRAMAAAGVVAVVAPRLGRPARAAEASDLMYFTWGGFEDPELYPDFAAKWGQPSTSFYADEYEAIEKMRAGFRCDIVSPCIDVMPNWMRADLQPLDESRLAYLDDTFEAIRSPEAAFVDGERYWVPTNYGLDSFLYRTDLTDITPEMESWKLMFDDTYKGRMTIWDSTDAVIPVASLAAGYLDDPFRPSGERLETVEELIRKQRDLVRFYYADPTSMIQAFTAGEVVLAFAWGPALASLTDSGIPYRWAHPKEGYISYVCGLARGNREGTDDELVYDFINASMTPESGKHMIEAFATGSANVNAYELVDEALLKTYGLYNPTDALADSHTFQFVPVELKQKHIQIFDDIRAGA